MSKVAPHNAVVEFIEQDHQQIVLKRYRAGARYTAGQENHAYKQLSRLVSQLHGVRTAHVIRFDEEENALYLEFIPGATLHERINSGDEEILARLKEPLVELFWAARQENLAFDSDPSNIMFDQNGIVLIDPVCTELEIDDYSFIVFMWGLIKITLRNRRFWRIGKIIGHWKHYYSSYCEHQGIIYKGLNQQMVDYIGLVIGWNCEKNQVEGVLLRSFRYVVVIPIYMMVRLLFRWNLIKC